MKNIKHKLLVASVPLAIFLGGAVVVSSYSDQKADMRAVYAQQAADRKAARERDESARAGQKELEMSLLKQACEAAKIRYNSLTPAVKAKAPKPPVNC